jgi:AAHS family 4-hydroxybenzoate transporter-like MFS transporter
LKTKKSTERKQMSSSGASSDAALPSIGSTIRVTALSFLLMVADSYDVAALSFAVPELIRTWKVDKLAVGGVFSAGLFGLLVGSIMFGYIGDRLGRKTAIIIGAILFGAVTYATGWASSLDQLLIYRFIACVGLGGAVPNAVALTNEFAPKHLRVTAITVIFAGYAIGGTFGGVIAAQLVPAYGWPIIFQLGGAASLLLAVALLFLLPESSSYLAAKTAARDRAGSAILAAQNADEQLGSPFVQLFAEHRSRMTPLVWVVYVANSVTLFALVSWLPVLIEAAGLPRSAAALALSCFFLGGAAGGLVVGYIIDRSGMGALVGSALIACPVVGSLGVLSTSEPLLLTAATAAGFFTIGVQNSLHGVAGSIYPTPIRANGLGWALGFGKIVSLAGPFLGGILLSMALPVSQLFWAAAIPIGVVTVASFFLMRIYDRSVHRQSATRVSDPRPSVASA